MQEEIQNVQLEGKSKNRRKRKFVESDKKIAGFMRVEDDISVEDSDIEFNSTTISNSFELV
jgi:hypothetical protein